MKILVIFDIKIDELIKINKQKLSKIENKLSFMLKMVREDSDKWSINWFNNGILSSKFKLENEQFTNEKLLEISNSFNFYFCGINCISKLKSLETKLEIIKLVDELFIEQNKKLLRNKNISIESINQVIGNLGENDVFLLENYFGKYNDFANYEQLNNELMFGKMFLQNSEVPRGITIQSQHFNGSIPIYRHPCDKQPENFPFSPKIYQLIEKINNDLNLEINHALIQKYNDGKSNISEHSDKTLDIDPITPIINASFGTTRTLVLTNKLTREKQKIKLYNNSLFIMGLKTNMKWTHEIIKSDDTLPRISFTLRKINTFLVKIHGKNYLYGQGAINKTYKDLITNLENYVETPHSELIEAFSIENKSDNFSWEEIYGKGFNYYN
jgi:hypothetical protein